MTSSSAATFEQLQAERIEQMQRLLQGAGLDGWLIYDFRGLNPHATSLLRIPRGAHLTRRYFVWVPAKGQAAVLHNAIEGGTWAKVGAALERRVWSSHSNLQVRLGEILRPGMRVAMEYSPQGAVPYVSAVDGGTLERVRGFGVDVVSSADLLQGFLTWDEQDLAAHLEAVEVLMRAKDAAFELIHRRLLAGGPVTETEVQSEIQRVIEAAGMDSDHPVNVSFGAHAGDPHYDPQPGADATLRWGQCVLIDLWCRREGRPFADVTWMAFAGEPDAEFLQTWEAVKAARDGAVAQLHADFARGLEGWELDARARALLTERGHGAAFFHRLGHSLGTEQVHGAGANLDDLETHDTRRLLAGTAVTVEPGAYYAERGYGVRSEINVYLSPEGPVVTTPAQDYPYVLGRGEWEAVRARALGEARAG
ncbi:Xaa-Pro aminopeptidase [Deinobacterium chartae]|uniref:Xaa-Pro aminopeptidase n=1 Tax=Deinobacterium chartae TaxID=521158 RepID=A0A841I2P4_9DEIO|nr:M24 family metallopeptidase [Deinobacterium chartae]MBB6099336.1 Xaa-Pro aminopeptidase [Deinobacterium chartae]